MPLTAHGEQSALRSHRTPDAAASTASHPASLTIRIRPSVGRDTKSSRSDLGCVGTEIFFGKSEIRLDSPVNKPPDGQITRLCRSTCPPVTWLADAAALIDAGRRRARPGFVLWHSRSMPKCRSRFGDQNLAIAADRRTHSMKKPQVSLPDLIRQSIFLPRL